MEQPFSHFDMLRMMSIPNNFLGRSRINMSMRNPNLKNQYTTSTNYLSWTDENGFSFTLINDSAIRNFLKINGFTEIHGIHKLDAECLDRCGSLSFDEIMREPYSIDGAGLLYRNLAGYMQYCANTEIDFDSNNVEEEPDPYVEIEKMFSMFMSPEIRKTAEENVEGYNSAITGLDLLEQNRELAKLLDAETQDDCQ